MWPLPEQTRPSLCDLLQWNLQEATKHGALAFPTSAKPLIFDRSAESLYRASKGTLFHSDARHPLSDHATSGRHALRSCRPVFKEGSRWRRFHSKFRPHQLDHDACFSPSSGNLNPSSKSPSMITAIVFVIGWLFRHRVGDISLVMPVLGTKSVFVALLLGSFLASRSRRHVAGYPPHRASVSSSEN